MSDSRPQAASEPQPGTVAAKPSEGVVDLPTAPGRAVDKIPRNFGRYRILRPLD